MINLKNISKHIIITLMILITINISKVYAHETMSFKNITINDGLSQGTVQSILQDKEGKIWIGTNDGLNIYNGHEVKTYTYKSNSKDSIANGYILNIEQDTKDNIWVATIGGISKINSKTEQITNYYKGKDKGNLSDNNVYDILITDDGKIVIATANGIDIYNEKEDKFEPLIKDKRELTHTHIYELAQDPQGNIWAGTKDGVNKIDKTTKQIEQYLTTEDGYSDTTIYKIYFDKDNTLWIGTMDQGVYKIDTKNRKMKQYKIDKSIEEQGVTVRDILRDSKGDLWLTTNIGLAKYEEKQDEFVVYKKDMYDINSLCDNLTFEIMEDKDGLLWIGTYAGISIFDSSNKVKHYKNNPNEPQSIAENMVSGIYKDDEGLVWVGTNSKGVSIIDRESDKTYHINQEDGLTSNKVYDIKGKGSKVFISTDQGINIIDKDNQSLKKYNKENGLNHSNVRTILIDDNNYIWAGTMEGACIINLETDEVIDLSYIWEDLGIKDKLNGCIFKDSKGNYWIGNFLDGGMIKIDPKTGYKKHYTSDTNDPNTLSNDAVRVINEDKEGNLWIGTSYGLNKFNPDTEEFKRYTTDEGLPNNTIYGIVIDANQNLWCSTNFGITKFDREKNKFLNFNIIDGLQGSEFNGKSYHISKDYEIFFGGTNGVNAFKSNELYNKNDVKPLVIESIKVNDKEYRNNGRINLKHNQNSINIEMFLPYYKNVKDTKYYYKLVGIDDKYKEINSNKLILANLSPGKYTLELGAANGDTISEKQTINFTINPVFWKSKEALVIYIFIIIVAIVYYKNKVEILDSAVDKRTKQLTDQIKKNQELYDKVLKLERKKNNYFVNLSHELRTPLNVISSTEQLVTNISNKKRLTPENLSHHMNIIKRNTERLLELITNLMDIEKIEYGKYTINKEEQDIVQVIEDEALRLKNHIECNGIDLIIDPEVEEKIVSFDKKEMKRCIENLISNAVKYTPEGGQIYIGIQDLGDKVSIYVQDTGIGINKENQQTIFDRFRQVVDANEHIQNSSGLGLTITRDIVKLHGGEIFLESELGQGSKFTIVIPVGR